MHFKLASSLTMFPLKSMLGNFLLMYLMAGSMPLSVRKESRFFGSAQVCGEMKAERVGLHIVFFILLTPSFHHLVNISVNIVQMLCFSIQLKAFDLQSRSRLWRTNISFHTSLMGRIFNMKLPWRSCAGSREMSSSTSQASKLPLESSLFFKLAYSASSHSLIPF